MACTLNGIVALVSTLALVAGSPALAQSPPPAAATSGSRPSFAFETDILSYFFSGYSAMANVSWPNKLQAAFGIGRYDVPGFLVESDPKYDVAKWDATVTDVQVFRTTYRFNGPRRSGPAVGGVILSQNWRLRSAPLGGQTTFRELSAGVTGGYYIHVGPRFYVYPTAAFTFNDVVSGSTSIAGMRFETERFSPNASLHLGWAF